MSRIVRSEREVVLGGSSHESVFEEERRVVDAKSMRERLLEEGTGSKDRQPLPDWRDEVLRADERPGERCASG